MKTIKIGEVVIEVEDGVTVEIEGKKIKIIAASNQPVYYPYYVYPSDYYIKRLPYPSSPIIWGTTTSTGSDDTLGGVKMV